MPSADRPGAASCLAKHHKKIAAIKSIELDVLELQTAGTPSGVGFQAEPLRIIEIRNGCYDFSLAA
jgi:hypothetical protein